MDKSFESSSSFSDGRKELLSDSVVLELILEKDENHQTMIDIANAIRDRLKLLVINEFTRINKFFLNIHKDEKKIKMKFLVLFYSSSP